MHNKENGCKKVVIIGLGNPLLADDSVGLWAVDELTSILKDRESNISFSKNYSGGIDLIYEFQGFKKAILIDSILTENPQPGKVHELNMDFLNNIANSRIVDSHGVNLSTVIATAKKCNYEMPEDIVIYAIEGLDFTNFCEEPSLEVKEGLKEAVRLTIEKLKEWNCIDNILPENLDVKPVEIHH
ncbi:MAG: hydrogenase maturation protease [uncultured bacterium]|nr:MAG: hydrogenase maturation protease [uncultured bacterium]